MAIRPLPLSLAKKATADLNERPSNIVKDLQHIKDWIAKQPHLKARTDDQWLVAFLRGCKYSLEKTKEKLDLYYSVRSTIPDVYNIKHTDPIFDTFFSLGSILIMPKTAAPDAPRVTLIRPAKFDASEYNVLQMMAVSNVIQKIVLMEDDNSIVAGTVIVLDLEGVSLGHFVQMTPVTIKKLVVSAQDASPIRMKGIHFMNTPPGFETIYKVMMSLLNSKNQNRLFVHNTNYEELFKYVPKEVLPKEYGGSTTDTKDIIEYWKEKVKQYNNFLLEDEKYCTDESKRIRSVEKNTLGIEGSFRQLEVD